MVPRRSQGIASRRSQVMASRRGCHRPFAGLLSNPPIDCMRYDFRNNKRASDVS